MQADSQFHAFIWKFVNELTASQISQLGVFAKSQFPTMGRGIVLAVLSFRDMHCTSRAGFPSKYIARDELDNVVRINGIYEAIFSYSPESEFILVVSLYTGHRDVTLTFMRCLPFLDLAVSVNVGSCATELLMEPCGRCESILDNTHQRCAACKTVAYCNKTCQKLHWKTHKDVCQELRARRMEGKNLPH
jgi:hypothetical protein